MTNTDSRGRFWSRTAAGAEAAPLDDLTSSISRHSRTMNSQSSAGLAINAPGAKATPQNGQATKKLVMRPLKCESRGLPTTAAAQDSCINHKNSGRLLCTLFDQRHTDLSQCFNTAAHVTLWHQQLPAHHSKCTITPPCCHMTSTTSYYRDTNIALLRTACVS